MTYVSIMCIEGTRRPILSPKTKMWYKQKQQKKGNFEETSGMDKSQSGQTILFASALQSETCDQIKDFKMTPGPSCSKPD